MSTAVATKYRAIEILTIPGTFFYQVQNVLLSGKAGALNLSVSPVV